MRPDANYLKSKNGNKDLLVIKDLSLFEEGYDEKLDSFHHKAYAETLIKLVESNEPPLSIGLFGPWGTGKSTILNIVNGKVENKGFACVYFNAWKYAGDSFRRQFLLNVIEKLFCKEEKEKFLQEIKIRFHREIPVTDNSFRKIYSQVQKWLPKINLFGTLSFSFPMLETDPRLVLPEQFEEEFKNMLNPQNLRNRYPKTAGKINDKNFLFIIDDIDRCPPEMVITILDSVKTFLTPKKLKCFFILALDDKAVITTLRKRNKNYSDEELLKFFDVTVRMNALKKHDLVSFANIVAEQSKLPERVIQIAVYGGFDTPRKIKHFLNTFLVRHETAKKRFNEGFLIEIPDLNQLSKLLVIETKFPQIYKKIIEDSDFIQRLQKDSEKFSYGKEEVAEDFRNLSDPYLYKFLWATRSITIDNPEVLIYLKLSQSANVLKKDGVKIEELTSAIERFMPDKLSEFIKPIQSEKSQKALVDFIKEELEPATELFLENITASALYIFENLKFNESSRKELCRTIAQDYIKERVNIFNLPDVELLFKCVNLLTYQKRWYESLKNMGLTVLEDMKEPQKLRKEQLLNISKFINYLYLKQLIEVKTSTRINTTLKGWIESPEQLIDVLENIEISKNDLDERAKKRNLIPNYDVIKPLIDKISIKEEVLLCERIRKIVFKFWQVEYLDPICKKLNSILTDRVPQVTTLTPEIKFALETIIGLPAWLDEKIAFPIAQQIWIFYTKCPDPDDKILSLKAYLISTYSIPDEGQKNSLREQFLGQLHALNPDQYKNILKFIKEYPKTNNWWGDLEKDFIVAIFNLANKNLNNPSLAIPQIEFVWEKGIKFLDINQVATLFKSLINHQIVNDNAFPKQRETIITFVPRINTKKDGFLAEFCNDLYTQITNLSVSPPISNIRRKEYLIVLTTLTKTSGNESLRINVGQKLMGLLSSSESVLQNIGIESLPVTQEVLDKDFGLYLSSSVKELCNKPVNGIPAFQQPILKTVEFQKKWDPDALNRFSDMVLRCLTNPDSSIQNMGGIFLEKAPKLSGGKKRDITNAIINLCSVSLKNKERCEPILSSKKNILNRKLVDEYFKKAKDEGKG